MCVLCVCVIYYVNIICYLKQISMINEYISLKGKPTVRLNRLNTTNMVTTYSLGVAVFPYITPIEKEELRNFILYPVIPGKKKNYGTLSVFPYITPINSQHSH